MSESLSVSVNRVLYPPETVESATWFILDTDKGVCKGNMGWRPRVGERLELSGKYSMYQGKREFKFEAASLDLPNDPRGMLHYVCEMAHGIGTSMEELIWDIKGDAWASVQEGEIPRLNGKVYHNFMESIERAEQDREKGRAIASLIKAGCTMNMASAAYELWKESTLGVVSSNPYRLAELPNYGFSHVDGNIRLYYGIEDNDPRRIRAAVIYVLRQLTDGGSTLIAWDVLNASCLKKLGGFQDLILQAVREMFEEGTLKGFRSSKSIALASDFRNESMIWEFIQK